MPRSKANWSRRLPKPLEVGRRKLRTLDDVRAYLLKLPAERQALTGWHQCAGALLKAANGGSLQNVDFTFKLARMIHRD